MGARLPDWLMKLQRPGPNGELEIRLVSFPDFRRLVREAMTLTGESAFGLLVGERLLVQSHGLLGYAAINSLTLRQAFDFAERYSLMRTSLFSVKLTSRLDRAQLKLCEALPLGDIRAPVFEAVAMTVKNLIDHVSVGECRLTGVYFAFEQPPHAKLAQRLFACEVHYGSAWTGLELPIEQLDRRLRNGNLQHLQEAERLCQSEMIKLSHRQDLSIRVKRLMLEKQGRFPSLEVCARLLNLTSRTLHRRLKSEGTSFREILEEVRHRLAVEYIAAEKLTLQEVAYVLGYDDLSTFRRAFKRWEGMSPRAWKTSEGGGTESSQQHQGTSQNPVHARRLGHVAVNETRRRDGGDQDQSVC